MALGKMSLGFHRGPKTRTGSLRDMIMMQKNGAAGVGKYARGAAGAKIAKTIDRQCVPGVGGLAGLP